jgi:hypothetical protein
LGNGLITDYSPAGIVSFELAPNIKDAKAIVNAVGKKPLQINVAVDFAFIIGLLLIFLFMLLQSVDE